jgi:hypothetical protein
MPEPMAPKPINATELILLDPVIQQVIIQIAGWHSSGAMRSVAESVRDQSLCLSP